MAWTDVVRKVMHPQSNPNLSDTRWSDGELMSDRESQPPRGCGTDCAVNDVLARHLARAVDRMNVSYSMIFDGESAQYVKFVNYFDKRFSALSFDEFELMTHLIKSCSGRALWAIQSYEGVDGGYDLARKVLERRFGKPYEIVERTMTKISAGPRFKPEDSDGLNVYASQLESAYETLRTHYATAEANSEHFLLKIFNRLPQHLQQKWLGENQKIQESKDRNPKFREMVTFIMKMAKTSDTIYKVKPNNPPPNPQRNQSKFEDSPKAGSGWSHGSRVTSLATGVQGSASSSETSGGESRIRNDQSEALKCAGCEGDHAVARCPVFASWNHRQ
jgi:hypothetical protein